MGICVGNRFKWAGLVLSDSSNIHFAASRTRDMQVSLFDTKVLAQTSREKNIDLRRGSLMRLSRSEKNSSRLLGSVLTQFMRALKAISSPSGNSKKLLDNN